MSMPELSNVVGANPEQTAADAATQMTKANQRVTHFMVGAQKLMLEELVFLGNEFFDRAQTETHLFSEFVSKMAGAHSVKDIRTMYEECAKHQLEFIRRDCDRMFKNGERVIDAASNLFKSHPLN
ncbi:MAG: hypothetical protein JSS22_04530 [Proteobacteria bacterium]|nr:hypothetical protein [Pseudomonadota bacterium]